ncbi:RhoA inhibitor [Bovine papular stomatitis virus]
MTWCGLARMSSFASLFRRISYGRSSCVPRTGCMPLRRPRIRSNEDDTEYEDEFPYGGEADVADSAVARPLVLTVPGANRPVLVDSVLERSIPEVSSLVTHIGEWTEICLFESPFCRAPVRVCRSVLAKYIYDADGQFEVKDSQALKLRHGEWYMRQKVSPEIAAFVVVICMKNDGVSALSVNNTKYLNTNMTAGNAVIFPAIRGMFLLPHIGGDVEYLILTLTPTQDLLDNGYDVFSPSVDQDAQIRTASAAETRKRACVLVSDLISLRIELEECYHRICKLMIVISEFGDLYSEVGAKMITESVDAIAKGMGSVDVGDENCEVDGAAGAVALCRRASSRSRRRPVSVSMNRSHSLLNIGLNNLFAMFAQCANGTPHPDSLMARMEQDLQVMYSRFTELWDTVLEKAADLDSTLPRTEVLEKFIHLQVCNSPAGIERNQLVQRLTMLAGSGYRLTGSGEGVPV